MEKKCPYCGAPLPEEASFCPHCVKSINRRSQPQKPLLIPVKVLRGILLCGVLAVLAGVLYLSTRPQTVEGMGEVYYTDDDGTYQLVTNVTQDRYTPLPNLRRRRAWKIPTASPPSSISTTWTRERTPPASSCRRWRRRR